LPGRIGLVATRPGQEPRPPLASRPRRSGVRLWLAGLWGGGVGELVDDHDAAEGGLVEALVVGQDVLVEDLQDAPVELAHVLLREVQQEARRGPNRARSCLAKL